MEWNRGTRPTQPVGQPVSHPTAGSGNTNKSGKLSSIVSMRFAQTVLLFSATILILALVGAMVLGGPSKEDRFVDGDRMQAVFLNGGQVYFGRINDLNDSYLRVSDIYYLRVNQQVQPNQENAQQASANDISLVKLGCELHGPEDSMLINREHVIFWENLKDDGQVAKAVEEYKKQNPDGQKCDAPAEGQQQSGGSSQPQQSTGTGTGASGSTQPAQQTTGSGSGSQQNNR